MKLHAFDGGFHTSKALNNLGQSLLRSQGGLSAKSSFNLFSSNGVEVTLDKETWMFDDNQSSLTTRSQADDWVFSTMYKALMLGTLCSSLSPNTHDLVIENLWTGLPYLNFENTSFKEKFRKYLVGEFAFHCGIKRAITIENAFIVPQCLAPVFFHLLDNNGNLRMRERESFAIGSINIGGNTTELGMALITISNGQIGFEVIHNQCKTEYTGMFSILSSIQDALSTEFVNEKWLDEEIFKVLRTNQVTLNNIDYDVSRIIEPIKQQFQTMIVDSVNVRWSKQTQYPLSKVNYLVCSGGGAYTVAPRLRQLRKDLMVSGNPQMDTVWGYYKLGRNRQ